MAADSSGNFVVVWQNGTTDVLGQRYASSGAPLGPEFRVNKHEYAYGLHAVPTVAADSAGNFVVVWEFNPAKPGYLLLQRFAASGAPLGTPFWLGWPSFRPVAAVAPAGDFVVVWQGFAFAPSLWNVIGQRFDSSGAPSGPKFLVNTFTTGYELHPSVGTDASGNFVVVWDGPGVDDPVAGIFGQRFTVSGDPLGPEFRVNTYTTNDQRYASVAADPAGNFVVTWQSEGQDGSGWDVFGQRFASSGAPLGAEFRVNTSTTAFQGRPSVSADASGNFVVVWMASDREIRTDME